MPLYFLFLFFLLLFLFVLVEINVLTFAFAKLGLSPEAGLTVLFAALAGSGINIPLYSVRAQRPPQPPPLPPEFGLWRRPPMPFTGRTVIAVNLGGCVIPVGLSLYLLHIHRIPGTEVLLAIALVAAVSYFTSRPVPGMGIAMPMFVAPLAAVLVALLLDRGQAAPLAYVGGTLGVLIGADLLHLPVIPRLGAPIASIGGAGTFDGIFFTGVLAALLA